MKKVILVSTNNDAKKAFKTILPSNQYTILTCVESIAEAKKKLHTLECDLLIIQSPCKDELGVMGSQQIKSVHSCEILFLVKRDLYDRISYQLRPSGIVVMATPCKKQDLYQMCEMLMMMHERFESYEKKIRSLKTKLQNEHTINHAKLILIENYHWSESRAHEFIEQASMQTSKPKIDIAKEIIDRDES